MKSFTYMVLGFVAGVAFLIGCSDSSTNSAIAAASSFWKNIGVDIYYLDGKVGIGTDAPRATLEVNGDWSSTQSPYGQGALTIAGQKPGIKLEGNSLTNNAMWLINSGVASNGGLQFFASPDGVTPFGGAPKMNILTNGNVGIGITDPDTPLAVSGLPNTPPDASGNAGVVCVTAKGNFWLDDDGTPDCT